MPLKLYPHQEQAYEAMVRMLEEKGRAAVIHPTGTGKSYIAFKLIEEHPKATFLWLAPSEYIFRAQLESLQRSNPELKLARVRFATYSRLLYFSADELEQATFDYLVLDEFHRCGSEQWGAAVETLMRTHPAAKVLGLSATHIRYLDHQRDMAEELFDNCIASEMTLGEAVVRGILPAPKYVTTVYQYQHSLERYQRRIETMRSQRCRERSEKYLQALRRAMENADGLDQVFARHMTDKQGRYIVFCASVSHMKEMHARVGEWFRNVDADPRCYLVYSESAEASKAYDDFCKDDSDHLKLLFCVNMLNEGIHVEGISGVILFRPTVSPIVYKQQIGRALTAGDMSEPLILDVVNNVESLYSIGSIEQEMLDAAFRLRQEGQDDLVVRERFEVIDQVKDCRELFEQLEGSLHIDWEEYYQAAARYREENGDLMIPQRYVTEDGKCLGSWLTTQRKIHNGSKVGVLTEEQVLRLDKLGIVWTNIKDTVWEDYYALAKAYYEQHGHLNVPMNYTTEDGHRLGTWLSNMRVRYASLSQRDKSSQTKERIRRMEAIGMVWNVFDARWEHCFALAEAYYREHGDLLVPVAYTAADGTALGVWIANQRSKRKGNCCSTLTREQIARLDSIGMAWGGVKDIQWMSYYNAAKRFFEHHGNLRVSKAYKTDDGLNLGVWLVNQRSTYKKQSDGKGGMSPERIRLLNDIGMVW